jgi:hypothetical protein
MNNWLSKLALIFSIAALSLSVWNYSQANIEAGRALQRRERELVEYYTPGVQKMCKNFGMTPPNDPKTLDELLAPLAGMMMGMQ